MARKAPTFDQLIAYIDKDADAFSSFSQQLQKDVEHQAQQIFQYLIITPVYTLEKENKRHKLKLNWKEASQIAKTGKPSQKQT